MDNFEAPASIPVISCPSSPDDDPTDEVEDGMYTEYPGLTTASIRCAIEEHDLSPPLVRSSSFPDPIYANHNLSGNHQRGGSSDTLDEGALTPPPTVSPDPPPPPPSPGPPESPPTPPRPPAPPPTTRPTGFAQAEMRAPSPDRVYLDMAGDLEVMMEIARSMHELARHTKSLLHAAYERVDLSDRRVRNLGTGGVLRDLRQESAHAVVDGQRAQLRYEKVLADVRRLRRCLRNLGFWRPLAAAGLGGAPAAPSLDRPPAPDATWGLHSHDIW